VTVEHVIEGLKERIGRQAAFIAQLRGRIASLEQELRECRSEEEKDGNEDIRTEAGGEP
jgi:uncharacterized coiled-coil protein SlyX